MQSDFITEKKIDEKYEKAVNILTSQGKFYINLGLERISKILELSENPQDNLKIIHVAGTNGKGSTCAMLASVLTEAGFKTALYTSPHLIDYTERIKINGCNIPKEIFYKLVFHVIKLAELHDIHVTEFEILTAIAFIYFNEQNVDCVILETGLGGRFDATNIIKNPVASIITTIDIDHTDRLGNSIEQIAYEKAGIIKKEVPVITLYNNKGLDIIKKTAAEKSSPVIIADYSGYKIEKSEIYTDTAKYELSLSGVWQLKNLALVLKTLEFLNNKNIFISEKSIKSGLKNTVWPGRFQYIKNKNIILDGAHNLSGAVTLRESLDYYFPEFKKVWIYSSLDTKDYESIINVLFKSEDIIICTKSLSKNAVKPEIIKEKLLIKNPEQKIILANDIKEALNLFLKNYFDKNYLAIIAGSLYTVGEALLLIDH